MVKKVNPYQAPKQAKLKQATTEWLITNSLPFNVVNRKGYQKIIYQFDLVFISPSNKSILSKRSIRA